MSAWIRHVDASAHQRLFCLPYAGGGTADYLAWRDALPGTMDLCPVVLPGREARLGEPPLASMAAVVEGLLEAVRPLLDVPYAIYGHSMGAWIGYELVRALQQAGRPLPDHLFVGARQAPHLPSRLPALSALADDAAFVAAVQDRYRAIPEPILASPDVLRLFLPVLRADFRLLDEYAHTSGPPLPVPLTALYGTDDPLVSADDVRAWEAHTSAAFTLRAIRAGHFFLREADDVPDLIAGAWRAPR